MILSQEQSLLKARFQFEEILEIIDSCSQEHERIDLVERNLFDRLLSLGLTLLTQFVANQGTGDVGENIQIDDEVWNRLDDLHERRYLSIFGELNIPRTVYGTRETQKIQAAPLDERLGLPEGEFSYVLEDWLQRLCLKDSFAESVDSLATLLHLRPSVRSAEAMNHRLAEHSETFRQDQPPIPPEEEQTILVVTADGKGVVMRKPDRPEDRSAEPSDERSSKSDKPRVGRNGTERMAYVGAVYSIAPFVRSVDDVMDELKRKQRAKGRPSPVGKRVWAEMTRLAEGESCSGRTVLFAQMGEELSNRNPDGEKVVVCLMDGERALWETKRVFADGAIEILDLFHVLERLWTAAHVFHPRETDEAERFVEHRLRMLLEGKVNQLIGGFRQMVTKHGLKGKKREKLQKVIGYYENNRSRMKYDEYLAAGYPIGSGVAEGACRHLVKDRLERTGMRWLRESAQSMLHLRAIYLNGDWDDFIENRIQHEQCRLYDNAA